MLLNSTNMTTEAFANVYKAFMYKGYVNSLRTLIFYVEKYYKLCNFTYFVKAHTKPNPF